MKADPKGVLTGAHFLDGDHACCEGALAAGCRFVAGYPITPSTEVVERIAARFPVVGGLFVQMEDEIASSIAIQGAVWSGAKAMTVTSGPGFSLMMEHIGLAVMLETPCVFVNVQRGGPSTGLPTLPGQADIMQARWGSHGDYEIIAFSPNSPQECFDLTIEAFNMAETYRVPVMMMMDECVGHMTEKVVIPEADTIEIVEPLGLRAESTLAALGYRNVDVKIGDGYRGWPEHAPFDAIIVTAAPDHVPQPLVDQLAMGGRMVIPVGAYNQSLVVLTKTPDGLKREERFGVRFVPMTGEAQHPEDTAR